MIETFEYLERLLEGIGSVEFTEDMPETGEFLTVNLEIFPSIHFEKGVRHGGADYYISDSGIKVFLDQNKWYVFDENTHSYYIDNNHESLQETIKQYFKKCKEDMLKLMEEMNDIESDMRVNSIT